MVGHAGEGLRTLTGAGAGTCSCGTYNLGAIAGGRLAVLTPSGWTGTSYEWPKGEPR